MDMMEPTNAVQQVMEHIEAQLRRLMGNALTAAEVRQAAQALALLVAQLQQSGLPQRLAQVIATQLEQGAERAIYNPCEAAKAARQLIQALNAVRQEGLNLQQLYATAHIPFSFRRMRYRAAMARQSRGAAGTDVMGGVAGLALASGEAHLALAALLHLMDARYTLAGTTPARDVPEITVGAGAAVNSTTDAGYLTRLPPALRGTEVHRARLVRIFAFLIGQELVREAQAATERLQAASLDQVAYRPSAVVHEAVQLLALVARAQLTLARLYELAAV
ncbi:MAG TPA: hypothetical protein VGR57_18760 [Ktedonobacterales bacterium]|nr:hypothetical protein [Ktedonobacterales bacterium]